MSVLTVGVNDCQVSRSPEATLITHALGSCIAVMIYDPAVSVAGLLHFMLPEAGMDKERARERPCMFADTGVPMLFRAAYELGAAKRRLVVAAVGGAQLLESNNAFHVGRRNYTALCSILSRAGVTLHYEDVGGTVPRTARLRVRDGSITVTRGRHDCELTPPSMPGNKSGSSGKTFLSAAPRDHALES